MNALAKSIERGLVVKSPGERAFDVIQSMEPSYRRMDAHLIARASGRMIEEAVELCLACGLHPNSIFGHVADALHNEARKASCFPTELRPEQSMHERAVEIGDVSNCVDIIRHLCGIDPAEVGLLQQDKLDKMEAWAASGEAKIIDGLFYRKAARP
jgi:hypothetical protein